MSQIESWTELKKRKESSGGGDSGGFNVTEKLVDLGVKIACDVALHHPDNYRGTSGLFRELLDFACDTSGELGFPEKSDPKFSGGQCIGTQYEILVDYLRNEGSPTQQNLSTRFVLYGAITDVRVTYAAPGSPGVLSLIAEGGDSAGEPATQSAAIGGRSDVAKITNILINPLGDGVDNCGNSPDFQDYPDSGEIPRSRKCSTIVFDDEPIEFCLTEDSPAATEVCFESEDYIICLDADGINLTKKEKPVGEKPFDEEDFDEEDAECTPPEDIQLEASGSLPEGVKECEGSTEELKWLLVTVTKDPIKGQTIVYPNPNDDHMFAGWIAWKIINGGQPFFLPPEPIRKRSNAFRPPDDINGYNVYSTNGAKLSIKELKETKQNASRNV